MFFTLLFRRKKSRRHALEHLKRMQLITLFELKKFAGISQTLLQDIEKIHEKLQTSDRTMLENETANMLIACKNHITLLKDCYVESENIIGNFISSSLLDSQFELGIMKDSFHIEHMLDAVLDSGKMRISEKALDISHTITGQYKDIKLDPIKVCSILLAILDLAFYYVAPGSKVIVNASTSDGGLYFCLTFSVNPQLPHAKEELLSYGSLFDAPQVFLYNGLPLAKKYLRTFNGSFIISKDTSANIEQPISIMVKLYNTQ